MSPTLKYPSEAEVEPLSLWSTGATCGILPAVSLRRLSLLITAIVPSLGHSWAVHAEGLAEATSAVTEAAPSGVNVNAEPIFFGFSHDDLVGAVVVFLFAMGVYVTLATAFLTWYNWNLKQIDKRERELMDLLMENDKYGEKCFLDIEVKNGRLVGKSKGMFDDKKKGKGKGTAGGKGKTDATGVQMNREERRLEERRARLEKKKEKREEAAKSRMKKG